MTMVYSGAVAVIPARGGSKGIKKKNLQEVGGVSLVGRSIVAAKGCSLIDTVLVTTDCTDISHEVLSHGAIAVKRPDDISGDSSTSEAAVIDCINKSNLSDDTTVVFMQATSPFCQSVFLEDALRLFHSSECDSMSTVYKDHGFWWRGDEPLYDPMNRPMRQEQRELYKEAGMFYIFKAGGIRKTGCRLHGVVKTFVIPRLFALEIDDYDDLTIARSLIDSISKDR